MSVLIVNGRGNVGAFNSYYGNISEKAVAKFSQTQKTLTTCPMCGGKDRPGPRQSPLRLPALVGRGSSPALSRADPETSATNAACAVQEKGFARTPLPPVPLPPARSKRAARGHGGATADNAGGWDCNVEVGGDFLPSINQPRCEEPAAGSGEPDLLPPPQLFDCPVEALRAAINNMRQTQWSTVVRGVRDVVQVARFSPELLLDGGYMPLVSRTLCSLLRSLRSHVTRTACQAAQVIFKAVQSTQRPEFDELVGCLLHKTADMNRFIRQDANEALDAMVTFISPFHAVRALVDKGAGHKNPLVRTATARLLTCVVMLAGADSILGPGSNKDTRRRVLNTTAAFLADGNLDTRTFAKQLFRALMAHDDFENIFYNEVDRSLTTRIEKTLVTLRYQDVLEHKPDRHK